jgi:hypothetical protein
VKPDNVCHADGCGDLATWRAVLILRGTPLKGDTTLRVCDKHRFLAKNFILNSQNRDRLMSHLVAENFCDIFLAHGVVRHNAAVTFEPLK